MAEAGDALPVDQAEGPADYGKGAGGDARRWIAEYELGEKFRKKFRDRCRVITKRYRDERGDDPDGAQRDLGRRYNIFWSNIETLKPATYSKLAKPNVERRWKDSDPMGRAASQILERALMVANDTHTHAVLKLVRDDYLLYAQGVPWIRYEPKFRQLAQQVTNSVDQAAETAEKDKTAAPEEEVVYEKATEDHIKESDFGTNDARDWAEVYLCYRKAYMTRDELVARFGEKIGRDVPLDYDPNVRPKETTDGALNKDMWKKATVVEMWNKPTRKVIWINPGYPDSALDEQDDPLELEEFFPCPRPAMGTTTTNTIIPVPDYVQYQDQADELDDLTARIARLVDVCRVMGLYDASQTGIARLFQEGAENQLIPIESWATFTKAGGMQGTVDWFPLDMVIQALKQLYESRSIVKAEINEITGIADIVRGNSSPSETATAQQIKGQFATLRLRDKQEEMARLARDLMALKAEIICAKFRPETLALMAGVDIASDPQVAQLFTQAVALLRNDALRNFRIEIETDSTIALDENAQKQSATEFMTMLGETIKGVVEFANAAAMNPVLAPLGDVIGQAMLFTMRAYKTGRSLESAMESAIDKMKQIAEQPKPEPPPDPKVEAIKAQSALDQQKGQQELQQSQQEHAQDLQFRQAEGQMTLQQKQAEFAQKTKQQAIKTQMETMSRMFAPANGRMQ